MAFLQSDASTLRKVTEMKCPVCGHQNRPNARFCTFCGAMLTAAADDETLRPGQMMDGGTYRIIRPLGKGGMGAVYLAANTKAFDRLCVVKQVIEYYNPLNPAERTKALQRFEAEARTLASLKHPGIPDIYAYFSENGRNYLVMEYIEGPNLAEGLTHEQDGKVVQGHPLPLADALHYAIQICEVLDYLEHHRPPVVHNDIKPANIILDQHSGRAVLVDFGTAKTKYAGQPAGRPGRRQSSVYGTVGYAAPELYEGRAEPRSDVYALAATLYHLLTDDDPRKHPFDFPRLADLPSPLRDVLRSALDVDVQKRPSAAEFGKQLRQVLEAMTKPQPAQSAAQRRGRPRVEVFPTLIDLGQVSRKELFTDKAILSVRNHGTAPAHCQLVGIPEWLVLAPIEFTCKPGEAQTVELRGRVDHLPPQDTTFTASLKLDVTDERVHYIRVAVRVKSPERVGDTLMIAIAVLVLILAIIFFLFRLGIPIL